MKISYLAEYLAASAFFPQEVIYVRKHPTNVIFPQESSASTVKGNGACITRSEVSVEGRDGSKRNAFAAQYKIFSGSQSDDEVAYILTKPVSWPALQILLKRPMLR